MSAFGAGAFASEAFASQAFGPGPSVLLRELGGRRSAANNALLRFISNEELDALQEHPELLRSLQLQEDDEFVQIIVAMLTRGLL